MRILKSTLFLLSLALSGNMGAIADDKYEMMKVCNGSDKPDTIPNVIGLFPEEAEEVATFCKMGFKVLLEKTGFYHPVERYKQGVVGLQWPRGGVPRSSGEIHVYVNAGWITPQVTGLNSKDAREELENLGFIVTTTSTHSSDPFGQVVGQSIAAGARYDKQPSINLVVSKGSSQIKGVVGGGDPGEGSYTEFPIIEHCIGGLDCALAMMATRELVQFEQVPKPILDTLKDPKNIERLEIYVTFKDK